MILSSRQSPRLALRRVATLDGEKSPLLSTSTSTSSRFSFSHLMQSPPPSPGLPALVPRHGKPAPSPLLRRYLRVVVWLAGFLGIIYVGLICIRQRQSGLHVAWGAHDGQEYEMVGGDRLPDFPTPVVVYDRRGSAKWTVSIPPRYDFPLEPDMYGEICRQATEAANHVADLHNHKRGTHAAHYDYYHVDPNFLDVAEAESHGLLPGPGEKSRGSKVGKNGPLVGEGEGKDANKAEEGICARSMTFVLETTDAGLGPTLMMLWMAYGLAEKEGRAFFVDDSRWAYGKYASFFRPPPVAACRPPARREMLPCPHHARHLVVSAATAYWTFGGSFHEHFEDAHKMEVYRQRPMYELARAGYRALFRLADADAAYVETRIKELAAKAAIPPPDERSHGIVVGVHVRHGDRHPMEFQYSDSYIPLYRYSDKARGVLRRASNASGGGGRDGATAEANGIVVIASDDPEVYESDEFSRVARAQEQIRLASKNAIATTTSARPTGSDGMFTRFVDETVGWEGGFFAPMFWSLGRPMTTPAASTAVEEPNAGLPPTEEALRLRELVGRAYLMDLAVLGGASDAVVCAVSATGCKLLAVMMGWERAFDQKSWVNIDGEFDWKGISW